MRITTRKKSSGKHTSKLVSIKSKSFMDENMIDENFQFIMIAFNDPLKHLYKRFDANYSSE